MQRKLGVLVHGAGWVATQHIDAFCRNPHAEVVAISSRRRSSAEARAAEAGLDIPCFDRLEEALALPEADIVSICTPQHVHAENAIAAAQAGKHLVIEKPICNSVAEGRAIRDAIHQAGVKSVVCLVLRWNPLFRTIKRRLADGAIGQVYSVETAYQSYSGDWWRGFDDARTKTGGVSSMLVGGCHAVDALRWFASTDEFSAADPVEVFAYAGGIRGQATRQYDPTANNWHQGNPLEYEGLEIALVKFANGVLGRITVNHECIQPYTFPLEIFGDRGTIRNNQMWSHTLPDQKDWQTLPGIGPDSADVSHHPFQGQMDHFVACIRNDVESHCNFDDAWKTHEVVFAAQQCYATQRPVTLPLA